MGNGEGASTGGAARILLIVAANVLSMGISFYNAHLFGNDGTDRESGSALRFHMRLPIFAAAMYNTAEFFLAVGLYLVCGDRVLPARDPCRGGEREEEQEGEACRHSPSWWRSLVGVYASVTPSRLVRFILPCGVAGGINVALSNCSLAYVSLSFYTMVKSCAPLFILLFSIGLGVEPCDGAAMAVVGLIVSGVVLMVGNVISFNLLGFGLVFAATIASALRWSLIQVILGDNSAFEAPSGCNGTAASADDCKNSSGPTPHGDGASYREAHLPASPGPLVTIMHIAPVIALTLLLLSLTIEGPRAILGSPFFASLPSAAVYFGLCAGGGLQTFLLVLCEYSVIESLSVLTFTIVGIIKEVLTVALSVAIFGDAISAMNVAGAVVTVIGISMYNALDAMRHRRRRHQASDLLASRCGSCAHCNEEAPCNEEDLLVAIAADGQRHLSRRASNLSGTTAAASAFMSAPIAEPSWIVNPPGVEYGVGGATAKGGRSKSPSSSSYDGGASSFCHSGGEGWCTARDSDDSGSFV